MELLPEWAPNLHPFIVHFPIAFIFGAIGADLLSLLIPWWDWLRSSTVALYVVAGASAVATYVTGAWAADSLSLAAEAQSVLTEHSNLGWWTMWYFGVYGLLRLGVHFWPGTRGRAGLHALLLLVAAGGGYLLYETGEHGAEMVYRYGVGVAQPDTAQTVVEPGLSVGNRGWQWRPQSARAWTERMRWLEGQPDTLQTRLDTLATGGVALTLTPRAPVTFVVPDTLGAVQLSAEINVDEFDGSLRLLHHVQDAGAYDALEVEGTTLRLGRMSEGSWTTFATSSADVSGWTTIRVVGDGTHFRGYVGNQLVVHGHGTVADPGSAGLRLDGTGRVQLRSLRAEALL